MSACREYRRLSRRNFLGIGVAGALTLPQLLRAADQGPRNAKQVREMNAIFLWLGGGPAHLDMFDLKPDAPPEVRGEFNPIETSLPGCRISELFPHLAKRMHRTTLVRSITHNIGSHAPGSLYLLAGSKPLPSPKYPTYGSVMTKEKKGVQDMPPFVAVPFEPSESPGAGYLGVAYNSFSVNADPASPKFTVRAISLPDGTSVERVNQRNNLLGKLDRTFDDQKADEVISGLDRFEQQAYDIVRSPRARRAFDLNQEPVNL